MLLDFTKQYFLFFFQENDISTGGPDIEDNIQFVAATEKAPKKESFLKKIFSD